MNRFIHLATMVLVGGLLLAVTPAHGQTTNPSPAPSGSPGGGQHEDRLEKALSQLNLSAEQNTKIQSILGQREQLGQKETLTQIKAVLTPEQQQQLQSLMQQGRHHHGGRGGGGGSSPGGNF